MSNEVTFIGHITTPYLNIEDCPNNIQNDGLVCEIVLSSAYSKGLLGLNKGQNILVLYWFENTDRKLMCQTNQSTQQLIGTFALRSPHRPNPIAAATVIIEEISENIIYVKGLDCLTGTKLLDIKPASK
jgi:tRNA-Thr(GGU) m(6)t(6)A37 methyltransferase TsaA